MSWFSSLSQPGVHCKMKAPVPPLTHSPSWGSNTPPWKHLAFASPPSSQAVGDPTSQKGPFISKSRKLFLSHLPIKSMTAAHSLHMCWGTHGDVHSECQGGMWG